MCTDCWGRSQLRRERTDLRRITTTLYQLNWSYLTLTLFPSDVALCEVAPTVLLEPGAEVGGEEESRDEMADHSLDQCPVKNPDVAR